MFAPAIIELSVLSTLLSLFLDFTYREGNIFSWWLEYWAKFFVGDVDRMTVQQYEDKGFTGHREYWLDLASKSFWFKPLGYCIVCANVWHSLFICFVAGLIFGYWYWIMAIPTVLLSSFLVRFFHDKLL